MGKQPKRLTLKEIQALAEKWNASGTEGGGACLSNEVLEDFLSLVGDIRASDALLEESHQIIIVLLGALLQAEAVLRALSVLGDPPNQQTKTAITNTIERIEKAMAAAYHMWRPETSNGAIPLPRNTSTHENGSN